MKKIRRIIAISLLILSHVFGGFVYAQENVSVSTSDMSTSQANDEQSQPKKEETETSRQTEIQTLSQTVTERIEETTEENAGSVMFRSANRENPLSDDTPVSDSTTVNNPDGSTTTTTVTRWWETIKRLTFDLGKFSIPIKLGDFEQKSTLYKQDIVTDSQGRSKIVWVYKTHISGNINHTARDLKTFFTTTKDSGLGAPIITSIKRDDTEILNEHEVGTTQADLMYSTEHRMGTIENGEYIYTIETPVTDVRDFYALDFHTTLTAELKKGADLTYGGTTTVLDRDTVLEVPSTARLLLPGAFHHDDSSPVINTSGTEDTVTAGDYITDTSIRWTSSVVNNGNTPKTKTFDMTPDASQNVTSVKVFYYKPSNNGYVLERTETKSVHDTQFTVSDIPTGYIVQTEVLTNITNEKVNHTIPQASLEALKVDLKIRKSWEDGATPVDTRYEIRADNTLICTEVLNANQTEKVVENIQKFKLDNYGERKRIDYSVEELAPSGYYLLYSGSDDKALDYYFVNKQRKQHPVANIQCSEYGVTRITDLTLNSFSTADSAGWGGIYQFHFKIPANAKPGDYFTVSLPDDYVIQHVPNSNKRWQTLDPEGKHGAVDVYHVVKDKLKFVVTENGVSSQDYTGFFELSGSEKKTDAELNSVYYVNGRRMSLEEKRRMRVFSGIEPRAGFFYDPDHPQSTIISKEVDYTAENHFGATDSCSKNLTNIVTAHYEPNPISETAPSIRKNTIDIGEDYITWEVLFNARGDYRNYPLDRYLEDHLGDGIELYHGNNPSSFDKDIDVFMADPGNGQNYMANTILRVPKSEYTITGSPQDKYYYGPDVDYNYRGTDKFRSLYRLEFHFEHRTISRKVMVIRVKTKKKASGRQVNLAHARSGGRLGKVHNVLGRPFFYDTRVSAEPIHVYQYKFKKVENINGTTVPIREPARFALYGIEQHTNQKIILSNEESDDTGTVTFDRLEANKTYYFKEIEAPEGYTLDDTMHTLVVAQDGSIRVDGEPYDANHLKEIINVKAHTTSTSVELEKLDSQTGNALTGAIFRLQSNTGYNVVSRNDVNASRVIFHALQEGHYRLTEESAPNGYVPYTQAFEFDVDSQGNISNISQDDSYFTSELVNENKTIKLKMKNHKDHFDIRLMKHDVADEQHVLKDAIFRLFSSDQTTQIGYDKVTDERGNLQFENLSPGTYYIQEITSPDGYELNTKKYEVILHEDGTAGSHNADDVFVLKNMDNRVLNIVAKNRKKEYRVKLQKITEEGTGLDGSRFEIVDENGQRVNDYVATLSRDGFIFGEGQIRKLSSGTYYIKELLAPNGYVPLSESIPFTLSPDGVLSVPENKAHLVVLANSSEHDDLVSIKVKNYKPEIRLTKVSKDDTSVLLEHAQFTLYQQDGVTEVATKETDSQGMVSFKELALGTSYYLQEKQAPVGYQRDTTKYKISIAQNGIMTVKVATIEQNREVLTDVTDTLTVQQQENILSLMMKNTPICYMLKVIKVDAKTNQTLANARFIIKQSKDANAPAYNGQQATLTTGEFTFTNRDKGFVPGVYYLVEETAPEHYQKLPEPVMITIRQNGDVTVSDTFKDIVLIEKESNSNIVGIRVKNFKPGEFPKTGGIGIEIFMICGISIMLISVLYYRKKQ
ncbi:hypothetical protein GMA11_03035 [Granulicatella sp. zg-ZJ]|uniref:SpaA isopeptide-forming pilin-related protein n=1 Tax=Granulicatella sp. zg-ZJ TaxID=2678504 RepID=UPI0013D0E879|nr:hypothetical protein [Granulicatella sp. zg-ZJ]